MRFERGCINLFWTVDILEPMVSNQVRRVKARSFFDEVKADGIKIVMMHDSPGCKVLVQYED